MYFDSLDSGESTPFILDATPVSIPMSYDCTVPSPKVRSSSVPHLKDPDRSVLNAMVSASSVLYAEDFDTSVVCGSAVTIVEELHKPMEFDSPARSTQEVDQVSQDPFHPQGPVRSVISMQSP